MEAIELERISAVWSSEVSSSVPTRWERKTVGATPRSSAAMENPPRTPCQSGQRKTRTMLGESCINSPPPSLQPTHSTPTRCAATGPRMAPSSTSSTASSSTTGRRSTFGSAQKGDRFIPSRSSIDLENAHYAVRSASGSMDTSSSETPVKRAVATPRTESSTEFHRALADTMGTQSESRVLAFRKKAPVPTMQSDDVIFTVNAAVAGAGALRRKTSSSSSGASVVSSGACGGPSSASSGPMRHIPSAPEKILDAPDLLNDFYINPLDWSSANQLAVALGPAVYLWTASTGSIDVLFSVNPTDEETNTNYVSSVKFVSEGGGYLAVGGSDKLIHLLDVETKKVLRRLPGHHARVSALSWNQHILTSGGRDSQILHHDVRVANPIVGRPTDGHTQEVCSLQWAGDGLSLASGSNDNAVCIWDARGGAGGVATWGASTVHGRGPRLRLTHHQAAVKALAWSPYTRNVLASGGGTSDRTIKIWNTVSGACDVSVDTGSQVCSLAFNPNSATKELLSSHGFSENQLTLWRFPNMTKIKDLTGHSARVLHTTVSPDGSTVCSAAADETLRFWKVFGEKQAAGNKENGEAAAASGNRFMDRAGASSISRTIR